MTTPTTILDHLRTGEPFGLSGNVQIRGEACLAVGLDNGNDAAKIALLNERGAVIHVRIPTAHRPAHAFQGGQGEVTYRVGDEPGFWIGEAAIRNEGRALRVGSTATRIADARHVAFLGASLIEGLIAAGYAPGAYTLAIGFAIPNGEVVRETAESDRLIVCEETRQALKRALQGKTWQVTRMDERGRQTSWELTVRHLIPQAQSVGTFVCWAKGPTGATVTDYDAVTIVDIGGGDLQQTDISLKPYRMACERRGDGTIDIARGLRTLLPKARLNDVTAQHALVTRQALISGRVERISREVEAVIGTYGQDLVGKLLEVFQNTRRYMVVTGGGVILLEPTIAELLGAAGLVAGRDYTVVEHRYASVLNAVGALFAVLFLSARR